MCERRFKSCRSAWPRQKSIETRSDLVQGFFDRLKIWFGSLGLAGLKTSRMGGNGGGACRKL
jgi:hypothetical protein